MQKHPPPPLQEIEASNVCCRPDFGQGIPSPGDNRETEPGLPRISYLHQPRPGAGPLPSRPRRARGARKHLRGFMSRIHLFACRCPCVWEIFRSWPSEVRPAAPRMATFSARVSGEGKAEAVFFSMEAAAWNARNGEGFHGAKPLGRRRLSSRNVFPSPRPPPFHCGPTRL